MDADNIHGSDMAKPGAEHMFAVPDNWSHCDELLSRLDACQESWG